jgi:hypothetical protein
VILPGMWATKGGQSAAGRLGDHIVALHGGGRAATKATHAAIASRVTVLRGREGDAFAAGLHVLPDFHGARSPLRDPGLSDPGLRDPGLRDPPLSDPPLSDPPLSDPRTRGMIVGLDLDASFDGLCRVWWRAVVGLALGLRQILNHMAAHGALTAVLRLGGGRGCAQPAACAALRQRRRPRGGNRARRRRDAAGRRDLRGVGGQAASVAARGRHRHGARDDLPR